VGVSIEVATEVTSELQAAVAALLPQLNPALAIPTKDELTAVLADPAVILLLARDGRSIVGTATLVVFRTPAWAKARIEDVVVDEGARGRGVGESLVTRCIELAREHGAKVVDLQSRQEREAANRLYLRMGFQARDSNLYRLVLS
jgi:ribosomal protein S18 acetylase RimI-like enzyme